MGNAAGDVDESAEDEEKSAHAP